MNNSVPNKTETSMIKPAAMETRRDSQATFASYQPTPTQNAQAFYQGNAPTLQQQLNLNKSGQGSERKMQGAQSFRSKRDLNGRFNSVDENQFIRKAQEMVHSFVGEDNDLSKSHISANKSARHSVFSGNKEDPVIIDWNNTVNKNDGSYQNKTQFRAQASIQEADDFLSKQVSQLDAVSEVDSQIDPTPMNV